MYGLMLAALLLVVPIDTPAEPESPGAGLNLSPTPIVRSPIRLPEAPVSSSQEPFGRVPGLGGPLGIGAIAGGALLLQTRRRRDEEPFYVLVHGNGGSGSDFDRLMERMGITSDRIAVFDYREVGGGATSTEASRTASTERAAEALDRFIRDVSVEHSNVYSIHHSKGGAVGALMIGALDDHTRPSIDGYRGAALLDPAIAGGLLGGLQRVGSFSTLLPDNGGFNAHRCTNGVCRDVREHLGENSGVEVIAIRNPDATVTNFVDEPPGLRVYDLVDDGGLPAPLLLPISPLLAFHRVWRAHASVLDHEAVATCISAEADEPGSCVWDG